MMDEFDFDWLEKPYNELTDAQLKAVADFYQDWGDRRSHRECVYMMSLRTELGSLRAKLAEVERERDDLRARKDGAYLERNQCVALIARMAIALGYRAGIACTAIDGWSDDWHGCIYIDLPAGQVSWHYHDSQAHLFDWLPPYCGDWDGHDTPEKYRRVLSRMPLPNACADRLEAAIREAIQLLGMDRPVNPTEFLRAALEDK